MKLKLDLFDRTTSEFSANIDYLNVCFMPKAVIRSNVAMQALRLVGFLFLRHM
jgi:hypothetical protein